MQGAYNLGETGQDSRRPGWRAQRRRRRYRRAIRANCDVQRAPGAHTFGRACGFDGTHANLRSPPHCAISVSVCSSSSAADVRTHSARLTSSEHRRRQWLGRRRRRQARGRAQMGEVSSRSARTFGHMLTTKQWVRSSTTPNRQGGGKRREREILPSHWPARRHVLCAPPPLSPPLS